MGCQNNMKTTRRNFLFVHTCDILFGMHETRASIEFLMFFNDHTGIYSQRRRCVHRAWRGIFLSGGGGPCDGIGELLCTYNGGRGRGRGRRSRRDTLPLSRRKNGARSPLLITRVLFLSRSGAAILRQSHCPKPNPSLRATV